MEMTRADEAERAVIGAMLGRGDSIDIATQTLKASDFLDDDLAAIFGACVKLRAAGVEDARIDWLMVTAEARSMRYLHAQDLSGLAQSTPVMGNIGFYAAQVKDAATRRAFVMASQRIRDAALAAPSAADAVQAASRAFSDAASDIATGSLGTEDWETIRDTQDAPYDWLVPGYLERGDRLVVTGGEGMGKSHFLRQIAMMTAAGRNFVTGGEIEPCRVLAVDVENSARQWKRSMRALDAQLAKDGASTQGRLKVANTGRLNLTSESDLALVHAEIREHQPDMVLIGPLYKLTPKGINSDDDAAPIITAMDGIRDQGITLLLETHMGHARTGQGGDRDVRPRGSAALLGWPEFGKGFAPTPVSQEWAGDPDSIVEWIPWRGDRDFRPWPRYWAKTGKWPFTPFEVPR